MSAIRSNKESEVHTVARILTKEELNECLSQYYTEHYGARDSDIFYEQPAVNVWVFGRDGKIITLKSHILYGDVEVLVEDLKQ